MKKYLNNIKHSSISNIYTYSYQLVCQISAINIQVASFHIPTFLKFNFQVCLGQHYLAKIRATGPHLARGPAI